MDRHDEAVDEAATTALEELAVTADETARDQRRLAVRARRMVDQRRRGASWTTILDGERRPGALDILATSVRRLIDSGGRFRHALGRALVAEGRSTRQIARQFGVTHQRISTMLNRRTP